MLYKFEEWTDPETGEIDVHEYEVTRSSYEHLHNFMQCQEWAGQTGNTLSHGMGVFWCVIYCGY